MDTNFLGFVKTELSKLRPAEFRSVAEATGVPEGTIRKIHYNEVADPRIGTIQLLHDYFSQQPARPKTKKAA